MSVAPREQGWWRLLLGVALALSVPWIAQLRILVPIEQTILLIAPAMAACALASWGTGGRLMTFVAWGLLAGWMLTLAVPGAGRFDPLTRGWALILAASFALVSLVDRRSPFLKRGLSALAVALLCSALIAVASGVDLADMGRAVSAEFARRLDVVTQSLDQRMQTREWQDFAQRFPGGAEIVAQGEEQLPRLAGYAISLFPALLALESLAILGLAWSLYHRASRSRIGPPLARLSGFRFNDQFIWGVIAGVALATIPALNELRPLGFNLLVFFGALYALRGLGVLAWFVAPGKPTPVLLVLATVIAAPFVGVFAVGLGLVDTWLDWRSRLRPPAVT